MTETLLTAEKPKRVTKRGGLMVTDAEILERLQVPYKIGMRALAMLDADRNSRFPRKQPIWGYRRYWPAVEKWLELTGGFPQERKSA